MNPSKPVVCPFGAGSRICLGIHLAYMELRYAAAFFFRECGGARLAQAGTDDMDMEHYFLISPKAKHLYVTLPR